MTIMSDKDRLTKLIERKQNHGVIYTESQMDDRVVYTNVIPNDVLANYLLKMGVTEVVRCEDCKHWVDRNKNDIGYVICPVSNMKSHRNDFCSYGKRRK